jgi:hypothetical protein
MITLKDIQEVQTVEELENLNIGRLEYEISYRGGTLGFSRSDVAETFEIEDHLLPGHFGAYCNYLGGGMRGSICSSTFSKEVPTDKAELLNELGEACKRVYVFIENEGRLNDEEDSEGETNWDAKATKASRDAGIVSAY